MKQPEWDTLRQIEEKEERHGLRPLRTRGATHLAPHAPEYLSWLAACELAEEGP